tara:strand:+ start:828 stop:1697 length:870 start_codon:yes stop_codon:yes gene_type:complete
MLDPTSVLFITLDSCRFDSFEAARTPNFDALGTVYKAKAPGNFTFASHSAMFVGFTPGIPGRNEPWVNPKFGKIFKIVGGGYPSKGTEFMTLKGRNVVHGLRAQGYTTIGTGSAGWFDDSTPTAQSLVQDFEHYWFAGNCWSLEKQLEFVNGHLNALDGQRAFVFMNIGETHVPYWHEGADWDREWNPCRPFGPDTNDADECRRRQVACLEWVDQTLSPLLQRFEHANTLVCADHGDAWGEDGVWEHGIHHDTVMDVPLVFRLQHAPVTMASATDRVRGLARKIKNKLT